MGKILIAKGVFKMKKASFKNKWIVVSTLLFLFSITACNEPEPNWLKGNLHTHTFWSEGDELYVRVRVTSSADHIDSNTGKILGKQKAWMQPQE